MPGAGRAHDERPLTPVADQLAGENTRVLVEQLRTVDIERLDSLAGRLTAPEQRAVDEALALILDLVWRNAAASRAREAPAANGRRVASREAPQQATSGTWL